MGLIFFNIFYYFCGSNLDRSVYTSFSFWHERMKTETLMWLQYTLITNKVGMAGRISLSSTGPPARARFFPPCFGSVCTREAHGTPKHYRRCESRAGRGTTETPPCHSQCACDYRRTQDKITLVFPRSWKYLSNISINWLSETSCITKICELLSALKQWHYL